MLILRQRDLLTQYLFVLALEVLSCILERVKEDGFLSGFKVNGRVKEGLEVSHLLFADDTLVFCEASTTHLTYLNWLLMWFEVVSGLKIKLTKSELILVGRVEIMLGCKVGVMSTTDLSLPLGASHNSLAT